MKKVFAFVFLAVFICAPSVMAASVKLDVVVSIAPEAFFASQVGGDRVKVHVLVPPGQSPHTFEPTARQLADMAEAKLYFAIGMPFEGHLLSKIQAGNSGLEVVDVRHGINMRPLDVADEPEEHGHHDESGEHHHHGELDPHVWMSPRNAAIIAANMAQAMAKADPAGAKQYQANLAALKATLTELDKQIGQALAPLKGREVFVFHPAFGYLLADYGLRQVPIESMGKSPGPRRLALLVHDAKEHGVKVIFVQPQFPQKSAEAIAQAIGGSVVPLDPLASDYIANLRAMAQSIASAAR